MKPRFLSVLVGVFASWLFANAQLSESFTSSTLSSDWKGDVSKFVVDDEWLCLSDEGNASSAYFSTYSTAMDDCSWEATVRMQFKPSSSNYVKFYLCSNSIALNDALQGYYLQMGNTKKQIVLYRQNGATTRKLAESAEGRLDVSKVELSVRVVRSADSEWKVFSKLNDEQAYTEDFSVVDSTYREASFVGMFCKYTKTNATKISWSNILVSGDGVEDETPACVDAFSFSDTLLTVNFDEWVDEDYLSFEINPPLEYSSQWNAAHNTLSVALADTLTPGVGYTLRLSGVKDFVGNVAADTTLRFAVVDTVAPGDLIFTEVMFYPQDGGEEYVEFYNASDKFIDLSKMRFSTRKASDSSIYSSKRIAEVPLLIFPGELRVLTRSAANLPIAPDADKSCFIELPTFPSLRNEDGDIVLFRSKDTMIVDEVHYDAQMHVETVPSKGRGVALERLSLADNVWQSVPCLNGYASPGIWQPLPANSAVDEVEMDAAEVCQPLMDADGSVVLKYRFDEANYQLSVRIYSVDGICVRTLVDNQTAGVEGESRWDGLSDRGAALRTAPYVMRVEAIHTVSGARYGKSFVVLLSR